MRLGRTPILVVLTLAGAAALPARAFAQAIPIPPSALAAGGPAGLFSRAVVDFSSGAVEVRTLLFLPDGRIVRTHPLGGGDAFDMSRCNPDMCGRYQLAGDRMRIRWDEGSTVEWSYAPADGAVDLDGDRYRIARPVSATELVGAWATAGGNVYTFAPNGTFSFGTDYRALTGRYVLAGRMLTLTFQDGDTRTRTVFAAASGDPVGMISIEGEAYRRR